MKTWLITGASSGIGLRVTEHLLERGDRVAATARRPERLNELADKYGDLLWTAELDVTDPAQIAEVVDRAFAQGRVDVVFSNAGYGIVGALEELSDEQVEGQIATNLMGSIRLVRAVLPHLRAQGGGRILQVASVGGQVAYPGSSPYHAAKWGIEGFLEAVAGEVAEFGIGVTLIEPGNVPTGFAGSLVLSDQLPAYANGPVAALRHRMTTPGALTVAADVDRVAEAVIAVAETTPAPLRLTLGSDAYQHIQEALRRRLDELTAQRELAYSTDDVS